jgi:hypothetical protein
MLWTSAKPQAKTHGGHMHRVCVCTSQPKAYLDNDGHDHQDDLPQQETHHDKVQQGVKVGELLRECVRAVVLVNTPMEWGKGRTRGQLENQDQHSGDVRYRERNKPSLTKTEVDASGVWIGGGGGQGCSEKGARRTFVRTAGAHSTQSSPYQRCVQGLLNRVSVLDDVEHVRVGLGALGGAECYDALHGCDEL